MSWEILSATVTFISNQKAENFIYNKLKKVEAMFFLKRNFISIYVCADTYDFYFKDTHGKKHPQIKL